MTASTDLSHRERLGYNLAGHAAVGAHLDVPVESLTIDGDIGDVKFRPLAEIVDLRRSPRKRVEEVAQKYVSFTLSGLASELARIEKHHGITPRSKNRVSFLRTWQQKLFDDAPFEVEHAFATTSAWLRTYQTSDVVEHVNRLWASTYNLVVATRVWWEIELVAGELLKRGRLTGQEIAELFNKETPDETI